MPGGQGTGFNTGTVSTGASFGCIANITQGSFNLTAMFQGLATVLYEYSPNGTFTPSNSIQTTTGTSFELASGSLGASTSNATDVDLVSGSKLTLSGTGTLSENGKALKILNSGTFNIALSGSQDIVSSSPLSGTSYTQSAGSVLQKTVDAGNPGFTAGTSRLRMPLTINGGTFDLQTGTLDVIGTFTIANNATLTKTGSGTLHVSGTQNHGSTGTLIVSAGTLHLSTNAGSAGTHKLHLIANGSGTRLKLDRTQNLKSLSLDSGATAAMTSGRDKIVHTDELSIGSTSFIDIADNGIAINYSGSSPLSTIAAKVASGYASGSWNGYGINSSSANAGTYAVGYGEASTLSRTSFFGQSVDSTTVLVKYTYYGDANLDGIVDTLDFNIWLGNGGVSNAKWFQGDFNYDGYVDLLDFDIWLSNGGQTGLSDGTALARGMGSVVPEPASLGMAMLLLPAIQRRRRK